MKLQSIAKGKGIRQIIHYLHTQKGNQRILFSEMMQL